jgi:UDP-N-acetylglucosamine 2-epimerase (non-hydrolysing)
MPRSASTRRLKIMPIFGTRPEAVKMAPVIHALSADERFEVVITVTAQHREMLDQFCVSLN